jgi:NTP pyrophosphatase (non-canonical NTP hydrolase)
MKTIEETVDEIVHFRDERNWEQFHNSKDLALAISIEASELNELFLWKQAEDVPIDKIKEELADILIFSLLLAHKHNVSIQEIVSEKLKSSSIKYPIEKAKGTAKKYNEL